MKKGRKTNKEIIRIITALFIVSWASLAVFSFLYVRTNIAYGRVKHAFSLLQKSVNLSAPQQQKPDIRPIDEGRALDFMEWQFVLKDQVSQTGAEIKERISKIKDINKDKQILNLLYYNLGLSYTLAVEFKDAIGAFEEALKFDSGDAASLYNLGLLYSTYRQDPRKAIKYYKEYLRVVPRGAKSAEVKERLSKLEGRQ